MTSGSFSRRSLVGGALAGAITAGLPASRAAAAPAATTATVPALNPAALWAAISDLDNPQVTAAQLRVSGSAGRWYGSAGTADRRSGRPVRPEDKVRAGSITKVFVATVVLQLVAARRVELSTPVQSVLPGLLPSGFAPITVAQLLNHTSGLPSHVGLPSPDTPEAVVAQRYDRWTPQQIVATVTRGPLKFAPGTAQEYRGVNYVLLALLAERLTGRPYGEEIHRRIVRPLGLAHTVVPGDDPRIHGAHVHGYLAMSDGSLEDITVFDQSPAWGEGEIISTTTDLDRFLGSLFSGALLPAAQLEKMFTLPPGDVLKIDGTPASYSMGLQTHTLNGVTFWGKTGERWGYSSAAMATRGQERRFVLSFSPTRRDATQLRMTMRVAEALTT